MTGTNQTIESRIASLAIPETEREQAIAYVHAGENLANAILAILRLFTPTPTPKLRHNH